MNHKFRSTAYRYDNEHFILGTTLLLVLGVIALTAAATTCLSVVFVIAFLAMGYTSSKSSHRSLMENAQKVTQQDTPEISPVIQESAGRLQVEPVDVFIVPSKQLNAYTFGMDSPKAIVLYSSLFKIMDRDEIQFILGHEMGHVCLGHTWLNTLVGGVAGIPSDAASSILMQVAFRWWNRACEFSADRAGLLACGKVNKGISALIKLEAGPDALNQAGLMRAIQRIEAEDDNFLNNLGELLATHPMIVKRVEHLRSYATSAEYLQLQAQMDQNLR
jgi:Zn-dependent protease with chaperone function